MAKFWEFKNQQNEDEVELRISGEIVDDDYAWIYEWLGIATSSPNLFREELAEHKGKNIRVWIDSYGGGVFAGAGIYNALKEHDGKVTTIIDGKAMSAASVIAMAGDVVHMSPVGIMMIHNPIGRVDWGEAKDMRHAADVLDEVKETIINAYQIKTKKSRDKISEMMDKETFMSAKTALDECFIDKVLYSESLEPIENSFVFSRMAIQNSMKNSMNKFFEIAQKKKNKVEPSVTQGAASMPQPVANNNNLGGDKGMEIKTVADLEKAYPQLVDQVRAAAKQDGVSEERARHQSIDDISSTIDPDLVKNAKYENPISAGELAVEALKKDASKGQQYLENTATDTKNSGTKEVGVMPQNQQANEKQVVDNIAAGGNQRRGK